MAGNADFAITLLPGLNHLFQSCQTCSVTEYASLEETISPSALDVLTGWVQKHTRPSPASR
jgi:hypothetical protein